jgi:hypothetical protein
MSLLRPPVDIDVALARRLASACDDLFEADGKASADQVLYLSAHDHGQETTVTTLYEAVSALFEEIRAHYPNEMAGVAAAAVVDDTLGRVWDAPERINQGRALMRDVLGGNWEPDANLDTLSRLAAAMSARLARETRSARSGDPLRRALHIT